MVPSQSRPHHILVSRTIGVRVLFPAPTHCPMKFFAPHCEGWSRLRVLPLIFAFSALVASLGTVRAANEGTITGRIFSPASGEYLRNAQIRVDATGQVTTSEDGGTYRLSPIAAGPVTLIVT